MVTLKDAIIRFLINCLCHATGGQFVDLKDPICTHIIVDATTADKVFKFETSDYPNLHNIYIVYREWFWSSIMMTGRADEFDKNHAYPAEVSTLPLHPHFPCNRIHFYLLFI